MLMLWILAGCDILIMICGSLSGDGAWSYSLYSFLESYAPPYPAAIWLLPFSLVMIYFITNWDKEEEQKEIAKQAIEKLSEEERRKVGEEVVRAITDEVDAQGAMRMIQVELGFSDQEAREFFSKPER